MTVYEIISTLCLIYDIKVRWRNYEAKINWYEIISSI
jgi:hypothetical protein